TCSLYHYPSPPASSTLSLHDALPICPDPLAKCFTPTDFATCCVCVPLRTPQPFGSIMVTLLPRGKNNSFLSLTKASCLGPVCARSEEHTSELQSRFDLVCRLLLEKKK